MKQFNGAYPISGENLMALPVKAIGPAVAFYQSVLGFVIESQDDERAILQRDDARIGLVATPDHKPGEAGSFAIGVADLDAMRAELDGCALDLGGSRIDEWDGKKYRVVLPARGRERVLLLLQPAGGGVRGGSPVHDRAPVLDAQPERLEHGQPDLPLDPVRVRLVGFLRDGPRYFV